MISYLLRNGKLLFFLFSASFLCVDACGADTDPGLKFVENKNQWPADVHFLATIPGGNMTIGAGKFSYYFVDGKRLHELHEQAHHAVEPDADVNWNIKHHSVQAEFIGSNPSVPLPFGKSIEYYNYYFGNDETKWASKAYAYQGVVYPSFYNDVDLKVYSAGNHLKYDFVVAPSGDPSQIVIEYEGMEHLKLDNGNLILKTSLAEIIEKRPFAYQFINGERIVVNSEYSLTGNRLSFCFPDGYDPCYALVIDPLLIFSTYSGFTADNWGSTATPGEHGTLYSSGVTNQLTFGGSFSATAGAYQTKYGGEYDIGIFKYDSTGSTLLYATLLGGSESESPHSLVVNKDEELIVLGTTSSFNFPTTVGAYDRDYNLGSPTANVVAYDNGSDIFVARLSKDGTQLKASTYLGGTQNDGLNNTSSSLVQNYGDQLRGDVITDAEGNIYISSVTASTNFFPPAFTAGYDVTYNGGGSDALLLKLKADLSQIIWGTYLGGIGYDASHTLKLDSHGNIFIAGGTTSNNFPMVAGGYDVIHAGHSDGWIAKVDPTGTTLLQTTFTGTTSFDQIYFIDINANEEVYAYGQTAGGNTFPITPAGVYSNPNSGQFIQKFNNTLSELAFSTVFGSGRGIPDISPTAFLVNDCNNLYMAGWGGDVNINSRFWNNSTIGMPVSADAIQKTSSGSDFYFIVMTDNATRFLYGTYLGGNDSKTHVDGGTSRFDKGGIVYHAVCSGCDAYNDTGNSTSDFPTTQGAWSRLNRSANCNNAAFKFDLSSLKARVQTNSVKLNNPGLQYVCIPDEIVFENLSTGGEIFYWDLGDGTNLVRNDLSSVTHQYLQTGKYMVKLKAVDQGTCKAVDSTFIMVSVFKILAQVQDDDEVCFGNSYQLTASGGDFYEWKNYNGDMLSLNERPTVEPKDTTRYIVKVSDRNGCFIRDTVQLNVIPGITPGFDVTRESVCIGRPFLQVKNLTDSLESEDMMFFDFGDGNTSDHEQEDHHYEKDGVYTVRLVGTRHGCVYEKAVTIPVFKLKIPNIITPGGSEGLNDLLTIEYGDAAGVTPADYGYKVSLTIYNRWGTVLFKTDDYQYDWSGEDLASGVYYYEFAIQDHATCKSWLQIVK